MNVVTCPGCDVAAPPETDPNATLLTCRACGISYLPPSPSVVTIQTCLPGALPQDSDRVELPPSFHKRFRLGRVLGRGAMGSVVQATRLEDGLTVAIKFMIRVDDPSLVERFVREGQITREIRHLNVVALWEIFDLDGCPCLVTEYLPGGTLRGKLEPGRPMEVGAALETLSGVLAGLAACHARGIVHRDLKPENILLDARGVPKVADLGLARFVDAQSKLTKTGLIMGTPHYMCPEQAMGETPGLAGDVYAVACIAFELFTGRRVFEGTSMYALLEQQISAPPPSLAALCPKVPEHVAAAVMSALSKAPADRPADAAEFAQKIAPRATPAVVRSGSVRLPASRSGRSERPSNPRAAPVAAAGGPRARGPRALVAAAVATALILGVVLAALRNRGQSGAEPPASASAPGSTLASASPMEAPAPAPSRVSASRAVRPPRRFDRVDGGRVALRRVGALGFPQARSTILCDTADARVSAYSDAKWLHVQALLWNDQTDAETPPGSQQSALVLDVDANGLSTPDVDRTYLLDWYEGQPGLHYSVEQKGSPVGQMRADSRGRGGIRYLEIGAGEYCRSDNYLIPLSELGRRSPEPIRLAFWSFSRGSPGFFNSIGYVSPHQEYLPYELPRERFHALVLADRPSTLAVRLVPEGRQTTPPELAPSGAASRRASVAPFTSTSPGAGASPAASVAPTAMTTRELALRGDASAQFRLGADYDFGRGIPQDYREAVRWYTAAAQQGHSDAQSNLGSMYREGRGTTKDYDAALTWYRKSAEAGNSYGQNWLGTMYATGLGVRKDMAAAVSWFEKSANQANPWGQYNLATNYFHGKGVPQDKQKAFELMTLSAEKGIAGAQAGLAGMYLHGEGVEKDEARAARLFRLAADQGLPFAQNWLGVCYGTGRGVPEDQVLAMEWYLKAAHGGNIDAQRNLGTRFLQGRGTSRDVGLARQWFERAAEQGDKTSREELRKLGVR